MDGDLSPTAQNLSTQPSSVKLSICKHAYFTLVSCFPPSFFPAGKSSGLILRRIRAPVLQEARAIQLQQLAAAAGRWSLRDVVDAAAFPPVTLPPPDRAAPSRYS